MAPSNHNFVREILDTEINFQTVLQFLIKNQDIMLRRVSEYSSLNSNERLLLGDKMVKMFYIIRQLNDISKVIIENLQKPDGFNSAMDIFIKNSIPLFAKYVMALTSIPRELNDNLNMLIKSSGQTAPGGSDPNGLLIQPLQRPLKYSLLLKDLCKQDDENQSLQEINKAVKEGLEVIDGARFSIDLINLLEEMSKQKYILEQNKKISVDITDLINKITQNCASLSVLFSDCEVRKLIDSVISMGLSIINRNELIESCELIKDSLTEDEKITNSLMMETLIADLRNDDVSMLDIVKKPGMGNVIKQAIAGSTKMDGNTFVRNVIDMAIKIEVIRSQASLLARSKQVLESTGSPLWKRGESWKKGAIKSVSEEAGNVKKPT